VKAQAGRVEPVIVVNDLSVHYRSRDVRSRFLAIAGVSFEVARGEILGVVGESGSGKSTLAKTLAVRAGRGQLDAGFPEICGGSATVLGAELRRIGAHRRDRLQLRVGYLPQGGAELLDARLTVAENIAEPIYSRDRRFSSREAGIAVATLVDAVRLPLGLMTRYPYELSSGQRQRVALARSLILEPEILVADEPTRGVDVTVRSGVLDVLRDLQSERDFSALIVSSDLAVVSYIAKRTIVLRSGLIVGIGPVEQILADPIDPYLKALAQSRAELAEVGPRGLATVEP
jgi:ABC-type glutathione transport system ATPase component